jgi:hypothetical protein
VVLPRRKKQATRDVFGRPVPENFRINFRRDVLAEALWEYGEDELAEAALGLGEDDFRQVQRLAVWHHVNDPDPERGPKLTNARVMARAMIEWAERSSRDTKRTRRRTRPKEEPYDGAYHASLLSGNAFPNTPAENGDSLPLSLGGGRRVAAPALLLVPDAVAQTARVGEISNVHRPALWSQDDPKSGRRTGNGSRSGFCARRWAVMRAAPMVRVRRSAGSVGQTNNDNAPRPVYATASPRSTTLGRAPTPRDSSGGSSLSTRGGALRSRGNAGGGGPGVPATVPSDGWRDLRAGDRIA